MAFVLNNIDALVKEKITQKLSGFNELVGNNFDIQEVIPYCLFSNKTFQSKIHKITSEEREAYKTRILTLVNSAGSSEPDEQQINSALAYLFDDESVTASNLDEKFPKFSLGNFEALLANIFRINVEIFNVFETADDSEKIDLDDIFYNLPTVNNSLLIPANHVTSEQRDKYYTYPSPYCGTLSVNHDGEQLTYNGTNINLTWNGNSVGISTDGNAVKWFKLYLSLLFTTRQYNSLDTTKFLYGEMTHDDYYTNLNNANLQKYLNCVFENLKNETNSFDINKVFDGYNNYQSSDEQISVVDAINECGKFVNLLTNLYLNEVSINIQKKYPNLMSNTKLLGHVEGFDTVCQELRNTFKLIIALMSDGIYDGQFEGNSRVNIIPSYNRFNSICKDSIEEVIEDLITEYFGKTKPTDD